MKVKKLLATLGPGLLYAGAAVGVSHLVQSTRAGANFYFDLVWILLVANALKYPFFEFGPRYAAATGKNLVDGYREVGRWAVVLFAIVTVTTMFIVQAAVTIVTAGIAADIFNIHLPLHIVSAIILVTTMIILIIGKYRILDSLIKIVILLLTVSTLVAVVSSFSAHHNPVTTGHTFDWNNTVDIFFLIAFIGWMPAPIDVSVWQSLWTVAKQDSLKNKLSWRDSRRDFNIGYIGTALLALGFLTLGARVMFGSGEELSSSGVVFSSQLINMYTVTIGKWAYYFIAIAALTTMYSTTLTVIDAYPRVMESLSLSSVKSNKEQQKPGHQLYWIWLIVVAAGAIVILTFMARNMRFMVDLATTLSFVTAPVLAYLNYRVVTHSHMPDRSRPEKWLRIWSWTGIIFLAAFTIFYLVYQSIHNV